MTFLSTTISKSCCIVLKKQELPGTQNISWSENWQENVLDLMEFLVKQQVPAIKELFAFLDPFLAPFLVM